VGEPPRSALTIGVCMNTRGLMELIVLNIGKDLGLLPTDVFSMLVLMALASTFMATPLIRRLMRGEARPVPSLDGAAPGTGAPAPPARAPRGRGEPDARRPARDPRRLPPGAP